MSKRFRAAIASAPIIFATAFRAATAFAGMNEQIRQELPGCKDQAFMKRIIVLVDQHDLKAADVLFRQGIGSGACRVFYVGEKIVLEERQMFSGLSKIHLTGDPEIYWVTNGTVDPR